MKPRNLYRIIIGVLMLVTGIISIVLNAGQTGIGSILVAAGTRLLDYRNLASPKIWE